MWDQIRNFNCFIDGRGYAGVVEEVQLPKLEVKTEEWRGGGMDAPIEIDMGLNKLEAEITLKNFDRQALAMFGVQIGLPASFTLRAAVGDDLGIVLPVVVVLTGRVKLAEPGAWKSGELGSLKIGIAVDFYSLTHGVTPVYVIDVKNMIRQINGVDQLAAIRLAIGA